MGRRRSVQAITSADRGLNEDIHQRLVRYSISMGLRAACLVAAVLTTGWVRWLCVVGVVLLPIVAVLVANAGRARPDSSDVELLDTTALPPGSTEPDDATDEARQIRQRRQAQQNRARAGSLPPIDLRGGYLR